MRQPCFVSDKSRRHPGNEPTLLDEAPLSGAVTGKLQDFIQSVRRLIIERILHDHQLRGEELLGFGDGFVEIEGVKRVGGVAVAVASDDGDADTDDEDGRPEDQY